MGASDICLLVNIKKKCLLRMFLRNTIWPLYWLNSIHIVVCPNVSLNASSVLSSVLVMIGAQQVVTPWKGTPKYPQCVTKLGTLLTYRSILKGFIAFRRNGSFLVVRHMEIIGYLHFCMFLQMSPMLISICQTRITKSVKIVLLTVKKCDWTVENW